VLIAANVARPLCRGVGHGDGREDHGGLLAAAQVTAERRYLSERSMTLLSEMNTDEPSKEVAKTELTTA
jgi:hypothetical protein